MFLKVAKILSKAVLEIHCRQQEQSVVAGHTVFQTTTNKKGKSVLIEVKCPFKFKHELSLASFGKYSSLK